MEAGTPQSYHPPDWSLMWPSCKLFKDLDVDIWKADFLLFPAFNLKLKVLPVLHFQVNFYTERLTYMLTFKHYTGRLHPSRTIFGHIVPTIHSLCLSLVSLSMPSQALPDTQHFSTVSSCGYSVLSNETLEPSINIDCTVHLQQNHHDISKISSWDVYGAWGLTCNITNTFEWMEHIWNCHRSPQTWKWLIEQSKVVLPNFRSNN